MSNRKYFGTDGIRGKVGEMPITPDFVLKLGWAAGKVLARHGSKKIIIGKDTRISGYMLESALEAGLAAAGLSAAFNAPLAGILFIIEEMRLQFRYSLISIKAVFIGVIMSSIVFRYFNGEKAVIAVGKLANAPINTLWLYLVLGMLFGIVGVLFNALQGKIFWVMALLVVPALFLRPRAQAQKASGLQQ